MIGAITNALSSPTLANIAQNTAASVSIETGLKAVGRPSFILADKSIKPETKKYAATKEFLYQATCLGVYLALIIPVFKKGSFMLAKKTVFKNKPEFARFKNADEFLNYHVIADKKINKRKDYLDKHLDKFNHHELREELLKDAPEKFPLVKGAIELGSLVGSVLGLAVLAPQISHYTVHPIMKKFGMDKNTDSK